MEYTNGSLASHATTTLTDAERELVRAVIREAQDAKATLPDTSPHPRDPETVVHVPYVGDEHNGHPHEPEPVAVANGDPFDDEASTALPPDAAHPRTYPKEDNRVQEATSCWHDLAVANERGMVHDAREVRKRLVQMLITEAQEDLGGQNETYDMLSIVKAIVELDSFITNESYEVQLELIKELRAEGAQADEKPKAVRFRCTDCGKFMRLLPGNRRLQALGGTDMPKTFSMSGETLEALKAGLAQALSALTAATASDEGEAEADLQPDDDMSPRDTDTPETPPAIPTKADLQPDDDMSPRDSENVEMPGSIPTKAAQKCPNCGNVSCSCPGMSHSDLQPNDDMSPRDSQNVETPGAIPTKASDESAEAGMTLVMHDSGENGDPPLLPNIQTDPAPPTAGNPPPPKVPGAPGENPPSPPQAGDGPPGMQNGGDENDGDGGPPKGSGERPDGGGDDDESKRKPPSANAYKNPEEHRADEKVSRDVQPRNARAAQLLADGADPEEVQAALEEDAREAGRKAFGENSSVRRSFNLAEPADLDAWYASLELKQQTQASLAALSNAGQIGTPEQQNAASKKVATASQDVAGEVPDFDLSRLFSRD